MRLFIALEIPGNIKEYLMHILKIIDSPSLKAKFLDKNQMHLTLKFLGKVQANKLDEIKKILKNVNFTAFSTSLGRIGFFPNESYIRVIWLGLNPEDSILKLQKGIDEKLKNLFEKEKNFKPHITIARVKAIGNKEEFLEKIKSIEVENKEFEVTSFKLVKSTLTPIGPIYEDLEVFS
ncbi:RNA 2',3'-cyclic phosphodiesterase [Candidatus Woesearchaeota archaeon]|nr:RNA 2',3'-cyclic phosphodiesterase [Candidatus Woesearchaeota archaeon]